MRSRLRPPAPPPAGGSTFRGAHIEADFDNVFVAVDAAPVSLTRRELLLLRALVEHCNHTRGREGVD